MVLGAARRARQAMRQPGMSYAMALCACYAMPGTEMAYPCMDLRHVPSGFHAMCGTAKAYGGMQICHVHTSALRDVRY
eukprot:1543928-Rhodomonas_salina.2